MENKKDNIIWAVKNQSYSCQIYGQPNTNIDEDIKIHSIILDVYNETFKNNPISKDLNLRVVINKLNIYLYVEFNNTKTISSIKRIISKSEFKYSRLEPKSIISTDLERLFVEMYNYRKGVKR